MHAPPKSKYPIADPTALEKYDAFLFGIPTRYGNFPAQWKTFWDSSGKQWATGGFWGKYAGVFVSSAGPGGGQESTAIAAMSTFTHHGLIYVPLGYKNTFAILGNVTEVRGGSPWGAGTFAVSLIKVPYRGGCTNAHIQASDGSRQPTALELELATIQGECFGNAVKKVAF